MEVVHGTCKESRSPPEDDVISSLPEHLITDILHCLPIRDAVRTAILSRDWRFKWTMLAQLVFDKNYYKYIQDTQHVQNFGRIITRLLLHLKGVITKFVLYIEKDDDLIWDDNLHEDISNWVMFLSKKGFKELTLINDNAFKVELHSHLFSCLELKHLRLCSCSVCPAPSFCGFPNLLSLRLDWVSFESYTCGELLTRCPLLESLEIYIYPIYEIKRTEIPKLENLKVLSLPLCKLDNIETIIVLGIFQLMECFPKLQELHLEFENCSFSRCGKDDPISFPSLETLHLNGVDLSINNMLSCAIELICSSPNLKTLRITAEYEEGDLPPTRSSSEVDCRKMWPLQHQEVEFNYIVGSENEVCLIKSLLICSPLLKKMVLSGYSVCMCGGDDGALMFTSTLLNIHRASPVAEIDLIWL